MAEGLKHMTVSTRRPHQPTVYGDSLFGSVPCSSSSLQPLRTSQVHEVELGRQRFKLVDLRVVGQTVVCHVLLEEKRRSGWGGQINS